MPPDQKNEIKSNAGARAMGLVAGAATVAARGVPRVAQHMLDDGIRGQQELYAKMWKVRDTFEYESLADASSSIRLLKIEPGSRTDVLRCSLRTMNLNDKRPYTALSYTWQQENTLRKTISELGFRPRTDAEMDQETAEKIEHFRKFLPWMWGKDSDWDPDASNAAQKKDTASKTIILNGKIKKIFPSLYGALLELRHHRPESEYWMDALCINQDLPEEVTAQVELMGQIYQAAELVVVWLGQLPFMFHPSFEELNNNLNGNTIPNSVSSVFYPLYLVSRSYFTRIWVLQEIALASKVTFMIGEHQFGLDYFSKMVHTIDRKPTPIEYDKGEEDNVIGTTIRSLMPWCLLHVKSMPFSGLGVVDKPLTAGGSSLQHWLQTCIGRHATKGEDMLFAGLALIRSDLLEINRDLLLVETYHSSESASQTRDAHTTRKTLHGEHVKLWDKLHVVHYDTKLDEVLLNVAACVLSGPDNMNLLSISSRLRGKSEWGPNDAPSWIPRLVSVPITQRDTFDGLSKGFTAATGLQNNPKISSDGRSLFIDGYRLGKVQQTLSPIRNNFLMQHMLFLFENHDVYEDAKTLLDFMKTLQSLPHDYRSTTDSTLLVLAWASTCGFGKGDPQQSFTTTIALCKAIEDEMKRIDMTPWGKVLVGERMPTVLAGLAGGPGPGESCEQLQQQLNEIRHELHTIYASLKENYPDAPWPTPQMENMRERENHYLELSYNFHLGSPRSPRRICFTDTGYIGLAPTGAQEGDEIMLIPGAAIPYVFRRVDDALRLRIQGLEKEMRMAVNRTVPKIIARLSQEIENAKNEIGKRDGWLLIGEAYVEGVMSGEAIAECADRSERIRIF